MFGKEKAFAIILSLGSAGTGMAAQSWQCQDDFSEEKIAFTLTFESATGVSATLESGEKLAGSFAKHLIEDHTRLHGMLDYSIKLANQTAEEGSLTGLDLYLISDNYSFWGNGIAHVNGNQDGTTVLVNCKPITGND